MKEDVEAGYLQKASLPQFPMHFPNGNAGLPASSKKVTFLYFV